MTEARYNVPDMSCVHCKGAIEDAGYTVAAW